MRLLCCDRLRMNLWQNDTKLMNYHVCLIYVDSLLIKDFNKIIVCFVENHASKK